MPQLDAATYLSQVTWLVLFFLIFYRVTLNYILPSLTGMLKARAKKVALSKGRVSGFDGERLAALSSYDNAVTSSCGWVTRNLVSAVASGDSWRYDQVRTVDSGQLLSSNSNYLKAISSTMAQRLLVINVR